MNNTQKKRLIAEIALLGGLIACASTLRAADGPVAERVDLTAGKSHLIDTAVNIDRVSVAAPETVEAVPVSPRTLVINGKTPGETSLVLWLADGSRQEYDVTVASSGTRVAAARQQLDKEFEGKVQLTVDNGSAFVTGTVKNMFASARAISIAEAAAEKKVVNLLNVEVPPQEQQILLKVRFADVDRSKSAELGVNFYGAPQGIPFSATVGSFSPTRLSDYTTANGKLATDKFTVSDALNIFAFWPHLDVGATLKDLASKNVLQILAEPNVLAMNGKEASFITGGEFPFPTLQGGGSGVGQITVSFREFGVRIHFLPTITPRGTIRLHVTPEVSSLDYANALTISGITVPGLNTRRVETEIELENGQTFAIAGLLDRRTTEALNKIPGLADIPLLGKIFQTRTMNKTNSELIILVTPELVAPIPADKPLPDLERPLKFMEGPGIMSTPPRTPGSDVTGPPVTKPRRTEISVQELQSIELSQKGGQAQGGSYAPISQAPPAPAGPAPGVPGVPGAPAVAGDPTAGPLSGTTPARPPR